VAVPARFVGIDWVCPSGAPKKHLCVETLEAGFERTLKRAKVTAGENATLHLVRHWFASKTYTDKSIPLPVQMAIVGYKSVATAMRYVHVQPHEVAKAAREAATRRARAVREGWLALAGRRRLLGRAGPLRPRERPFTSGLPQESSCMKLCEAL
jgi:hypothetical protein